MRFSPAILIAAFLFSTGAVRAGHYRILIHGLSEKNHCNVNGPDGTDVNDYYKGIAKGSNVIFAGWDGTSGSNPTMAYRKCSGPYEVLQALNRYCRGGDTCEIYTHSTGALVWSNTVAYWLKEYINTFNIRKIQLNSSASGGSELADECVKTPILWDNGHCGLFRLFSIAKLMPATYDVTTWNARSVSKSTFGTRFNTFHYKGWLLIESGILKGWDDTVVAQHSLCHMGTVDKYWDESYLDTSGWPWQWKWRTRTRHLYWRADQDPDASNFGFAELGGHQDRPCPTGDAPIQFTEYLGCHWKRAPWDSCTVKITRWEGWFSTNRPTGNRDCGSSPYRSYGDGKDNDHCAHRDTEGQY